MNFGSFQHRPRRSSPRQGYILLVLGLFVALLAFATLATAPRVVQQIKRDREEEMIHRGAQYARAICKFVKKNGNYPTSLEQLEDTNRVRYLRRRYKDPYSPDGKWRVLHIGDVAFMSARQPAQSSAQQSGQPGGILGQPGGSLGQPLGAQGILGQPVGQLSTQSPGGLGQPVGQLGARSPGGLGQPIAGSAGLLGGSQGLGGTSGLGLSSQQNPSQPGGLGLGSSSGAAAATGGLSSQPSSQQGLSFGGGAILGVASSSEREGIKEFNGKSKYKEWYFVYDPAAEATNPNGGALITGPYTGRTYGGASGGIGTPASQLASPNQPSGFGQPIGGGFGGSSLGSSSPASSTPAAGSSPRQGQ
jgi:type II secretory pathway pseudopilin PulG